MSASKLTKEQKDALAAELAMPWGRVALRCDGYEVSLVVERDKGLTYRVMTYVNGFFKGAWTKPKSEAPESKFLRKSVRPNCSPAKRKQMEKALGKRYVQKDPYFSGSWTIYLPDWSSGKAALSHLCRVCESVEVIEKTAASDLGTVGAAIDDVFE
ncbi:MAG: hypothetical protein H7Z39_04265 [Burkholderiaceae bacterium]|nr:hypothetical protein [Burkholderiaceae bacterium]